MDFKITTTTIPKQRVEDLLIGAFEGGSNYWFRKVTKKGRGEFYKVPFSEAGEIHILTTDGNIVILNKASITKGLQIMQDKWPRHFGDFMSESDDSTTADVFLQCCVLGDIIYG